MQKTFRKFMAFGKRISAPGCDDAPVVSVPQGSSYKNVTIIMPYYENPQMLRRQVEHWAGMSDLAKAWLSAIVVDDGSPDTPAVQVLADMAHPFKIRLFRIEVDVRWNWIAARNIAMSKARGWCLLTDMDHLVPEETAIAAITGAHDRKTIYRFLRQEHTGEDIHPHPNSWLMTDKTFWERTGGYDEALSGRYGTDGEYRRRCAAAAPIRILTDKLIRYENIGDSSTTHYQRKQPEDAGVPKLIASRKKDWKPKVLSFPYHEVAL